MRESEFCIIFDDMDHFFWREGEYSCHEYNKYNEEQN